jgi:hypothetical protein
MVDKEAKRAQKGLTTDVTSATQHVTWLSWTSEIFLAYGVVGRESHVFRVIRTFERTHLGHRRSRFPPPSQPAARSRGARASLVLDSV